MTQRVGIWLDHRHAIVVFLNGKEARIIRVESAARAHTHKLGGSRTSTAYGPQDAVAEDRLDHEFRMELGRFYEDIVHQLEKPDALYLFGPGPAKREFRNHLESSGLAALVKAVEGAQALTDPEVVARVKAFFRPGAVRI